MPDEIKEKLKLQTILKKVKEIADDQFDGEVSDNILSIFNQLSTPEKRILLKGLINICMLLEKSVLTSELDNETLATKENISEIKTTVKTAEDAIHDDIFNIEAFNQKEMIKLRSWMVKFFSIGGVLAVVGFFTVIFLLSSDKQGMIDSVVNFFNVLKEATGF